MVYLSGAGLPGCPGKNAVKRCSSSSSLHVFDIPVSGDFVEFSQRSLV